MCTLVIASGAFDDAPLVVVANRDEMLDRPSSPPKRWADGFFAPRDEVAGGTWLGVNAHGVFVGITNRFLGPADVARASRGKLVTAALALPSARAVHDAMRALDPAHYNGFHLVYADGADVLATISDGATLAQLTMGRGRTIVTERSFGAGAGRRTSVEPSDSATPIKGATDHGRVARIEAAWTRIIGDSRVLGADGALRLTKLLTEHDAADIASSTCLHVPSMNYGTRSGTVIAYAGANAGGKAAPTMLWAEGSPCNTPFVPVAITF